MSSGMEKKPKPRPVPTPLDRPYWDFLRRHEFRLQQCAACATFRFPAAPVCAHCQSDRFEWKPCAGTGTVFSWVIFHKSYFPGFDADIPYNVAMIRLAEGPMFIANLVGIRNEDIRAGMPVEAVFDDAADAEFTILRFKSDASRDA